MFFFLVWDTNRDSCLKFSTMGQLLVFKQTYVFPACKGGSGPLFAMFPNCHQFCLPHLYYPVPIFAIEPWFGSSQVTTSCCPLVPSWPILEFIVTLLPPIESYSCNHVSTTPRRTQAVGRRTQLAEWRVATAAGGCCRALHGRGVRDVPGPMGGDGRILFR